MNIIDSLIVNIIYIIFPMLCYLFYVSYNESFSKKDESIFFEVALFTSTYLCIKFSNDYIMLFNIPLIIACNKDKKILSFILSTVIVYYMVMVNNYNLIYLVLEYLIYNVLLFFKGKFKILTNNFAMIFIIINAIFKILHSTYLGSINWLNIILFPLVTYCILYLLEKAESISYIHTSIKEIEKEKQLRDSLFKITHEIKNPIAVCKGYLDMFDKNNPKHVDKFIPIIKSEIDRTLTIMNDFMEFSKIKLDCEIMDIEMLLEEVLNSLDNLISSKSIKLNYEIEGNEIFINGDYNRLKQVFINLFKNSVEALENISGAHIDMKYTVNDKYIVINISDNGIGMDKQTLDKIYDAFYTTKKRGTGLGVSLSKEIIEGHKGKIEYKSKENAGTNVKITLPIVNI